MANPIDALRSALAATQTPIVPKAWVDPLADAIDQPALDRGPWEAGVRGFGAGALEGLRQQLTPMTLAAAAFPLVRAARGALGAGRAVAKAAPTLDLIESAPVRQVAPTASEVDALVGDMQRNLARIRPRRSVTPPASAGARAPEFTAVGDEAVYNTARPMMAPPPAGESLYQELLRRRGGRGPM